MKKRVCLFVLVMSFYSSNLMPSDIKSEHKIIFKINIYPDAKYEQKETEFAKKYRYTYVDEVAIYSTEDSIELVAEYYKRASREATKVNEGATWQSDVYDTDLYSGEGGKTVNKVKISRLTIDWGQFGRFTEITAVKIIAPAPFWTIIPKYERLLQLPYVDGKVVEGKTLIIFTHDK